MKRRYGRLALALLSGVLLLPASAQGASSSPPASLLERVSQAFAAEMHGAVGMQRHSSTTIRAGPITHTEVSDSGALFNGGAFVQIKYYKVADDGKAFSATQLTSRNDETNTDWSQGKVFFKEPYDGRYSADYTLSAPRACSGCASGLVAVTFTSAIRDEQHGDGTMWIDESTARVITLTYTPNAMPSHATSGTVTERSSLAAPGIWYVTRIDETYGGREAIISGTGTFVGTFDHFKRFASVAQGQTALDDGTI